MKKSIVAKLKPRDETLPFLALLILLVVLEGEGGHGFALKKKCWKIIEAKLPKADFA